MEARCEIAPFRDNRVASRKAEEAALRRYRAAGWLETMVGPLDLSPRPSETEFVSRLRNGQALCNLINKIQPGAVPRVITSHSLGFNLESHPPLAYQYFENIRNFLVAVQDLKLPAFEASDLERDVLDSCSTRKIVDCILALKSFHEWKLYSGGNGPRKLINSSGKSHSRAAFSRTEFSSKHEKVKEETNKEDLLVKALCDRISDSKENINANVLATLLNGGLDPACEIAEIISSFQGPRVNKNRSQILEAQEKELADMKTLLSKMRMDVLSAQSQIESDLAQLAGQIQGLSVSAQGYSRAVKENRSLHNAIQDLKGNIRVYCRIKPSVDSEMTSCIELDGNEGELRIVDRSKVKDPKKIFQFNRVFGGTATQEEVYRDTQPLIRSVMDGYNVCIFSYGQTGSGKTHTMFGRSDGVTDEMGIIHRALNDLFEISCTRNDYVKYQVSVQMIEIYNEQVRDLLGDDPSTSKVEIRSCTGDGGLCVPDASVHAVRSTEDIKKLMRLGERNRVQCSTALNQRSSRSHSVLAVHVHGEEISGGAIRGRMHLVDLAGSERVEKSEVAGHRLKEAQHINRSLSCFGDVMAALGQKNSHVPYRNCKLTALLQDSLGGRAKTLVFAHVSPEVDSYEETISTLRFAQRVSRVELGTAARNRESGEVRKLREQVEDLKRTIATRSELTPPSTSLTRCGNQPKSVQQTSKQKSSLRSRRFSLEGGMNGGKNSSASAKYSEIRSSTLAPLMEDHRSRTLPEESAIACLDSSFESKIPKPESGFKSRSQPRTPELSRNPAAESSPAVSRGPKDEGSTARCQIRKSLLSFGRLINGDKRNQRQILPEKPSPSPSPSPAANRSLRRRSLINLPPPEILNSRRSSLGEKMAPLQCNPCRNSKTTKTKLTVNRWL